MRLKKEIEHLKKNQTNIVEKQEPTKPAYKIFGFKNNAQFLEWCFELGIEVPDVINKKKTQEINQIKEEEEIKRQIKFSNDIKKRTFSKLLENYLKGKISITRDNKYYAYLNLFDKNNSHINIFDKNKKINEGFAVFINHIIEHINVFKKVNNRMFLEYDIDDYAKGLKKIYEYKDFWVRDYEDWTPPKYRSSWWNLLDLMAHLFEHYPIPKFFKTVWFNNEREEYGIELYLDLCSGASAHKCMKRYAEKRGAPVLTKKQTHRFMNSKFDNVFEVAYKKFFLEECKVSKGMINVATTGRWTCSLCDLEMIKDFLLLIQKESLFDKHQIVPLWDYVLHLRHQMENEDKQFTLKNRSIQKLLNDMNEWHKKLDKMNDNSSWEGSDVLKPYTYEDLEKTGEIYGIKELTTAKRLIDEGKKLSHCVASYANSCKKGRCSIWSFYKDNFGSHKKLITLEVVNDLTLVQCRGKGNRLPTDKEWYHINNWVKQNGLKKSV